MIEVRGDETGRVWRAHITADKITSPGERWKGVAQDNGSSALLHRCRKEELWEDELQRLRNALVLARRPEIVAAPTIRQLIDSQDVESRTEEIAGVPTEFHGDLWAVWEWAEKPLDEFLEKPDEEPGGVASQIEQNVRAALAVIHSLDLIHLDVAPNNVLRVEGVWKLADLDNCLARGEPVRRGPRDDRWLHPNRRKGKQPKAREDFDWFGLDAILRELGAT